jgi:hypothetical protein
LPGEFATQGSRASLLVIAAWPTAVLLVAAVALLVAAAALTRRDV